MRYPFMFPIAALMLFGAAGPSTADDQALCFRAGAKEENIAACSRLISTNRLTGSELSNAYLRRGFLYGRRGERDDFDRTLADCAEALRVQPSNFHPLYIRAAVYIRRGDPDRALPDLNEAMRAAPQNSGVRNVFGSYYFAKGDDARALSELNEAIRISSGNAFAFRNRGLVYERMGELDKALADFRVALRGDPGLTELLGHEARQGIERVENRLAAAIGAAAAEPLRISVDGQQRAYLLKRPTASGPRPTLIMLHGAGGTAAGESGLGPLALAQGFAAVFPDGRGQRWNFHPPGKETAVDAEFFRQHGGLPDDVAFLKAIVADLVRRGIADPRRVHLAGFSLGGVMALRMACTHADMFAAIALLVSAMADVNGADCRPAPPLPALILSGTADPLIPYAGGRTNRGDVVWPAERLVGFFRRLNGCTEPALSSTVWNPQPQAIEVELSAKCPGGPVAFYRVVGGGHNVPPVLNGGQMLLDFFRDKVR